MEVKVPGNSFYGRPLAALPTIPGMRVGKRIRDLREARGLEQGDLAKLARIKQSTLSDLERGRSKSPRGDTLVKLAAALEVDPDSLMTGDPKQHKPQPDIEHAELLDIYLALTDSHRSALLAAARAMLGSQPEPPPPSPFTGQQKKLS